MKSFTDESCVNLLEMKPYRAITKMINEENTMI